MFKPKLSTPLITLVLVALLTSMVAQSASHRGGGGKGYGKQERSGGGKGYGKQNRGGGSGQRRDRVSRDFHHMDTDSNGEISRTEWTRRGNFDRLDTDGSDSLDMDEVRALYGRSLPEYRPSSAFSPPARIAVDIDQAALDAEVPAEDVDALTICGVTRSRGCDPFDAVKLGMRPTGLGPRFPDTLACKGIDDYWALDYSYKRNRQAWHGGIDMPADWGTPILAVADGSVVAVFSGENSKRGKEVIIRHSPEQTGIPYWTYSGYGHLDALPPFEPGQRIQQGQIIGPTGNSGLGSRGSQTSNRRAAIHFSVLYSESPEYAIVDGELVPKDARWMDPVGFYRLTPPYETRALKALPESEKFIDIPVMTAGAGVTPTGAQRIWPYACDTDSQSSRRSSSSSPQSAFDF